MMSSDSGPVTDGRELADLGVFRIPVPIPFRNAGGPANAYIIEEEDGILLFDAGMGNEPARSAFAEGMARAGHRFEEVNRIVLSHGHVDHFGGAAWIAGLAGRDIPVLIHEADAVKAVESGAHLPDILTRNSRYLSRLGVPRPVLDEMVAEIVRRPVFGRRLTRVEPLVPGTRFRCRRVTLEVHHMPGHTPGVCCLYDREHRVLFSADHLLEHVSPNPLIDLGSDGEPSSFRPLVSYCESLEKTRALSVDLVLPGHAEPFTAHRAVIDSLISFYDRRQAKLLAAFEHGPRTVYEAMRELFPSSASFELFLTLSETLGNLEALEDRGAVVREAGDDLIRFRAR
jgi:glyoxylase-like metal-dependent hydrolase (beta-lactamase superfamily II)